MVSWAIIATLKEPKFVTMRFVDYHLSQGAAAIYLFLDDPNDPALPALVQNPQVKLTVCDDEYWQQQTQHPDNPTLRQVANARWIYPQIKEQWCIHLDGDEFLSSDGDIGTTLSNTRNVFAQILPYEMTLCDDSLLFHGRIHPIDIFAHAPYPPPPYGLLSHAAGKYFCKTGVEGLELAIHAPRLFDKKTRGNTIKAISLLHYNNFTREAWVKKTENRIKSGLYDPKPMKNTRLRYQHYEDTIEAYWKTLYARDGRAGLGSYYDYFTNLTFAEITALVPYTEFVEPKRLPLSLDEIAAMVGNEGQ